MSPSPAPGHNIGGRLALDFANEMDSDPNFAWEELLLFLRGASIISQERSIQLLALPETDTQTASSLLTRARQLRAALDASFAAMIRREAIPRPSIQAINDILRITEGHDELIWESSCWSLEFVARENSLDWLLAAIARSAAEIIAEGPAAPLRACCNPACGLFFYDTSRTGRRRWCSMARCGNRHKVATFFRRHAHRAH